jgi:hypothetical protein
MEEVDITKSLNAEKILEKLMLVPVDEMLLWLFIDAVASA